MSIIPKANKDLGQHYLRDKTVISKIVEDYHSECDVIVEVGPGPGVLTKGLSEHKKELFLIEKDTRFKELLETIVNPKNIYFEDAVKFDWKKFITENNLSNKKIWLVSNLPYNISSILFINFLKVEDIKYMTLMFQKEVGEKTVKRENVTNQMSSLLALSLNYMNSKALCKVLPGAFNPPPKVDSIVVSYERKNSPTIELSKFKNFESFLRSSFQFKRKKLSSNLKSLLKTQDKNEYFTRSGVSPDLRAETLTVDELYSLYKEL